MDSQDTPRIDPKIALMVAGGILVFIVVIAVLLGLARKKPTTQTDTTNPSSQQQSGGFFGIGGKSTGSNSQIPGPTGKFSDSPAKNQTYATNLGITASNLGFIEQMRDNRGVYYIYKICSAETKKCEVPQVGNQTGIEPIWGRFKYYEKTKDPKDLEKINRDLTTYTDTKKISTIQNYSWNCRLMYELWQSNLFSADQKKKIQDICVNSNYYPVNYSLDPTTVDKIDLNQITLGKTVPINVTINKDHSNDYAFATSDFATQYIWNKSIDNLNLAKIYFVHALGAYQQDPSMDTSVLGLASYDMYQITKDNKYLSFAYAMYKKSTVKACTDLQQCINLALFSQNLYTLVKDQKYENSFNNSLSLNIDNGFDSDNYKGYIIGNKGFHNYKDAKNVTYSTRYTGLMAGLLTSH